MIIMFNYIIETIYIWNLFIIISMSIKLKILNIFSLDFDRVIHELSIHDQLPNLFPIQ